MALLKETSPDRGPVTYTYDAAGNVKSVLDARNVATQLTYDALNRVTGVYYSNGLLSYILGSPEDLTYTYDAGTNCANALGRLCTAKDEGGLSEYAYGSFGEVTQQRRTELAVIYTTRYQYDGAGQLAQMTYPDGRVVGYGRDGLGRIASVSATVQNTQIFILSNRSYRPDDLVLTQTWGNNLFESRQYNLKGELTNQYLGSADTRTYSYDLDGNMLSRIGSYETGNYLYDALDRLTQDKTKLTTATTFNTQNLVYDANGNRTKKASAVYGYTPNTNRLVQVGSTVITTDTAGNVTANGAYSFAYNLRGNLSQVTQAGIHKGTYTVNHLNQRTRKATGSSASTVKVFHYDLDGNVILETKGE
jgi:YD repeat-containing protein